MGSVKMLNHLFAVSHFTQFMRIDHLALCQNSRKRHTLNAYDRTTQNINHTSIDQT